MPFISFLFSLLTLSSYLFSLIHANKNFEVAANYRRAMPSQLLTLSEENHNYLWFDNEAMQAKIHASTIDADLKEYARNMHKDGFIVVKNAVESNECDKVIQDFKEWCRINRSTCDKNKDEFGHYRRLYNFHTSADSALDLIVNNVPLLRVMDFLFGAKTQVGNSILFSRGSQQSIHVDIPFFWTIPAAHYFGVWVALEDTDANNGPLAVLPGGHKCNVLEKRAELPNLLKVRPNPKEIKPEDGMGFVAFADATMENCRRNNVTQLVNVHIKKGDVIVWHPLLPHGGSAILDPKRSRFSFITHVGPELVPFYSTDVFFNPDKDVSRVSTTEYRIVKSRRGLRDFRLVGAGPQYQTAFGPGY